MENIGIKIGDNIYVDLESLFDIRFSVLENFFQNVKYKNLNFIDMIKKDKVLYYGRMTLGLVNIPTSYFRYIYNKILNNENKFKKILKRSKLTNVTNIINAETVLLESKKLTEDEVKVKLYVNTFPYTLTEKEKETLRFILTTVTILRHDDIEIVKEDNTTLVNNMKSGKYDVMFMYRGFEWIMVNKFLYNIKVPEVKLYTPAIFENVNIDVDKPEQIETLFNSYKEILEPYVDLTFLPHEVFSLSFPIYEKIKNS